MSKHWKRHVNNFNNALVYTMFVIASFFIILCLARHHGTNALKMNRLSCRCWIWIILAVLFTLSRPRPLVPVVCFFGRFAQKIDANKIKCWFLRRV